MSHKVETDIYWFNTLPTFPRYYNVILTCLRTEKNGNIFRLVFFVIPSENFSLYLICPMIWFLSIAL